jgi:hypothetical protein
MLVDKATGDRINVATPFSAWNKGYTKARADEERAGKNHGAR